MSEEAMITGVLPLRNAVKLDYPWELALGSLAASCDEVLVGVDPTSEDDTLAAVKAALPPHGRILESVWDMTNHAGHTNCEISVQTQRLVDEARGDWVFSLQADEMLHEGADLHAVTKALERCGDTAGEMLRLYFYGSLGKIRLDWTLWMVRLFRRGLWKPDVDGAMRFDPVSGPGAKSVVGPCIWHYSRIGDPQLVAQRVRNLDAFFHDPAKILPANEIADYDFSAARKLDTYVRETTPEHDPGARLCYFSVNLHPAAARARWGR